jgi:sec-independent protein translocase protein TatA
MGWLSPWDLLLLLIIAIVFFRAKRLPEIGRSMGEGFRELRHGITDRDGDEENAPPELASSTGKQPQQTS